MDELELITKLRSHVEPPDPRRTARARQTLTREFERGPSRAERWPWFRPVVAALVVVPAVALAGLLATGVTGGSGPSNADAAIVRRAKAALTPPRNVIFHTEVVGGGFEAQTWELTRPPYSMLAFKGPIGARTAEEATNGSTVSWWNPATNTIDQEVARKPVFFDDPLARVKAELRAGQARVVGAATVDGRPTYKIQFAAQGQFNSQSLVAYVDKTTYRPLLLVDPQRNGSIVRLKVTAFEYLPATRANLRLLSLTARHPGATVVSGNSSSPKAK